MIYNQKTGEAIAYSKEERSAALEVSLTALASAMGYTPVRSGNHYSLKEMDSLIIYNDRSWNRWSQKGNINGGTQIDFLLEFGDVGSAAEAIDKLLKFRGYNSITDIPYHTHESSPSENLPKENKILELPPKNKDYRRAFAYLIKTRGLSQEVVSDFVHRHLIYEDAEHHNLVFCGYDPEGNIRYAGLRGTADIYGKKFKMDVPGNDKNYGVNIVNKESGILLVFESVIDCMSYIDLFHDNSTNKLVLGMVEDNPLQQFLKDYSHIYNIKFCLDNDEAGHVALMGRTDSEGNVVREGLIKKYENMGFQVDIMVPPSGKDWNETLLNIKKQKNTIEQPANRHHGGR